jgi:hypothetical protein
MLPAGTTTEASEEQTGLVVWLGEAACAIRLWWEARRQG